MINGTLVLLLWKHTHKWEIKWFMDDWQPLLHPSKSRFSKKDVTENLHKNTGSTNRINVRTEAEFRFWCKNGNAHFFWQVFFVCVAHVNNMPFIDPHRGGWNEMTMTQKHFSHVIQMIRVVQRNRFVYWMSMRFVAFVFMIFPPWSDFDRIQLTSEQSDFFIQIFCLFLHWIEILNKFVYIWHSKYNVYVLKIHQLIVDNRMQKPFRNSLYEHRMFRQSVKRSICWIQMPLNAHRNQLKRFLFGLIAFFGLVCFKFL